MKDGPCAVEGCPCGACESLREEIPAVIRQRPPATPDVRDRKQVPVATGVYDYFPAALWEVAWVSYVGNEKHNPGELLHDARDKSTDDEDCLQRHFRDRGKWDTVVTKDGRVFHVRHSAAVAWRALRILQKECEADGAELARAAVNSTPKEI